jgi:hypothetical protein
MFINRKTTRIIAFVCALCFLYTSVFAQTQSTIPIITTNHTADLTSAIADGVKDAKSETNTTLWFAAGCFGTILGWLLASALDANPPAVRLIGKSPEYVAYYTDAYQKEARRIKTRYALTGCMGCVIGYVVYFVVLISLGGTTTTTTTRTY